MVVTELQLENFRNYGSVSASFGEHVNVITGGNAQGKTNLIEAIYYIAAGRSFRQAGDKEMIGMGMERASVRARVVSAEREQALEIRLLRGRRREFFCNGVKIGKAADFTGRLTAVQFGPDDLDIIKSGAAVRRKLMDQCLSQLRPGYLAALLEFNRLYEHKTRILRDWHSQPSMPDLLTDYNLRLAHQSARLIHYRAAFVSALSRRAAAIHSEFSDGAETLTVRYKTVKGIDPAGGEKPEQLLPILLEHQREHFQAELRSGMCLSGAHKDDMEIDINGAAARKFASQGQARTASVAIKLAERDIHRDDRGEYPVLLLDDVLSELDERRQSFILRKITNGQVFITCCDGSAASAAGGSRVLKVERGRISGSCICI